jgi:TPR repeat protein
MLKKTYLTCLILTSCSAAIMLSSCSSVNKTKSQSGHHSSYNNQKNLAHKHEDVKNMQVFSTPKNINKNLKTQKAPPSSQVNTNDGVTLSKEDHTKLKQVEIQAEKDDKEAQWKLGMIYFKGLANVTENDKEAFQWMAKSAAQKFSPAEYMLGFFYEHGTGVKKDMKLANLYYGKAKEHGFKVSENKALQF